MTIQQQVKQPDIGEYIELFIISDPRNQMSTLYLTPNVGTGGTTNISFGGQVYLPVPMVARGFAITSSMTAPPRPTLTLSNVNQFIVPYLQQYKNMTGMKVQRIRTLGRYLDSGTSPDASQHLPVELYFIEQKISHSRESIEFTLVSPMDFQTMSLPRRQVLRDKSRGIDGFPGIGLTAIK